MVWYFITSSMFKLVESFEMPLSLYLFPFSCIICLLYKCIPSDKVTKFRSQPAFPVGSGQSNSVPFVPRINNTMIYAWWVTSTIHTRQSTAYTRPTWTDIISFFVVGMFRDIHHGRSRQVLGLPNVCRKWKYFYSHFVSRCFMFCFVFKNVVYAD